MTWWARALYVLGFLGLVYWLYSFQLRRLKLQNALQNKVAEATRLKEIDELKTNLYTNITHEFRTPLTVIGGMASLIQSEPKKWLITGIQSIEQQCDRLLRMVNQMLDLQKIEAGKMTYAPVQSDIISFINFTSESFQFQAITKGLIFKISHEDSKVFMDFDPDKLSTVITNLLSNAIKYTADGEIQLGTKIRANES